MLTLVLLFGLQGEQIVRQPAVIAIVAVSIPIQVYFNAGLAYWLNQRLGVEWCVTGPSALIGASDFFELAVAAATGTATCDDRLFGAPDNSSRRHRRSRCRVRPT